MTSMKDGRPTQAVILAGGRGVRLMPLTATRPKPMIEFYGRPFLQYLVELLKDQGITRILLLLGYRAPDIQQYFGDGSRFGLRIEYSVSPAEDATGQRLRLARNRLDPIFLLLYCDNYWPFRLDAIWPRFQSENADGLLTVYGNHDHYTRDNLRVDAHGRVAAYDKTRTAPNLSGVDIGFMLLRREVLDLLPHGNASFEAEVLPRLAAQGRLLADVSHHRYYSIGSLERLDATSEFLARRPAVLLDRDGVLNVRPPRAEYVRSPDEWRWLPGAREGLRMFTEAGYRVAIISNQPGIARGAMSSADLQAVHARMLTDVRGSGGRIDGVYVCPHGWDDGCTCRKPRPGLLLQAQRDLHLDLTRTYFLGDDDRDRAAAEAAGCPSLILAPGESLADVAGRIIAQKSGGALAWPNAS